MPSKAGTSRERARSSYGQNSVAQSHKVQSSFLKKVQWALYYLQFRYVMSSKDITFIANSEYTKDCILSLYPKKNIPVIYNPIDKTLILEKKKNIIQMNLIKHRKS